jgi:hypothetical protein
MPRGIGMLRIIITSGGVLTYKWDYKYPSTVGEYADTFSRKGRRRQVFHVANPAYRRHDEHAA